MILAILLHLVYMLIKASFVVLFIVLMAFVALMAANLVEGFL